MFKPGHLLVQFFVLLAMTSFLLAGTTGKIAGVAKDATTGEPLFGVNVVVEGTNMGAATGSDGRFFILNVPPGLYNVQAQYIGYAMLTIQGVRVTVDITTEVDFEMDMEAIQGEQVIKVAERPLIEKKSTNERRIVRAEDLENLPVRDAQEIISLQTGAVKVGEQLYIRGGRREEVAYFIDGVYQVNDFDRFDRPESGEVSSNALEEVSFQAGGFDAEYGSATAGLINMSTKTGGSKIDIAGEVATDEFLSTEKAQLGTYSYGQNVYNLSLSGPITKNLSFYVNGEKQWNLDRYRSAGPHAEADYIGDVGMDGIADTEDTDGTEGDGIRQYGEYTVRKEYGPLTNNWENKRLVTGNLLFSMGNLRTKIGGNYSNNVWQKFNHATFRNRRAPFAAESIPVWKSQTYAAYIRTTWTISAKSLLDIQVATFKDAYQNGNQQHWDQFFLYGFKEMPYAQLEELMTGDQDLVRQMLANEYDDFKYVWENVDDYLSEDGSMISFQPELQSNGIEPRTLNAWAGYRPPGHVFGSYEQNETGYVGFNTDFKTQQGPHEIRVGAEMRKYLIRYYRIGSPERLASTFFNSTPYDQDAFTELHDADDPLVSKYDDYQAYIDNYWFQAYKTAYAENMGYEVDASSNLDVSLADNRDGPREPLIGGVYFQDKIELDDLVMNIGLRYDHINPRNFTLRDPSNVILDSLGSIAETVYADEDGIYNSYTPTDDLDGNPVDHTGIMQLNEREAFNLISPRLGFAFPVTDRTVFHAQYGKYVQQPQLNRLFLSYLRFAANLSQGNYTTSGNPELDPVRTTSYEIGFKQQLSNNSSIDLTVFYKQMTDYVQIRNVDEAKPVVYARYVNGDYGSVKGLSASFQLRRTGYIQAFVNYTLQYAGGTGSTGTGQYKIAWQDGNYPTFVSPLDFDQRHTGSVNVDFRTTEKDRLSEAGLNLLLTFGSGRRYTPMEINSAVFPGTSDTPIASLNSGTMPWVFQLDTRLDKNWYVGPFKLNTYLWVKNALDRVNVRDVHDGTGQADYDGWFNTPPGEAWAAEPTNNVFLYNLRANEPYNYESPRTVLLGVRFYLND